MSFRPRFRLSLLFILAALVAGVSVWLRQAVVRDRNIRQLLAEDWVDGRIVKRDHKHAVQLNTKFLNLFSKDSDYCDNIDRLFIYSDLVDPEASRRKYEDLNLGGSLALLLFRPSYRADGGPRAENHELPLSQICFWLERFPQVELLGITEETIIADPLINPSSNGSVEDLLIEDCHFDTATLKNFLGQLSPLPKNIVLAKNRIRGKAADLGGRAFPILRLDTIEKSNTFVDQAPE